jgi:oxaloacetate decarboxylase alpha subunit
VPDEVYKYVLGFYGKTVAPVDPNVLDKILGSARGREFLKWQPPQPSIKDLHRQFGGRLSDDQLLLQLMLPEESVEGIHALTAAPIKTDYPSPALEKREMVLVRELAQRANVSYVHCEKGDLSITLQRNQQQ